jgi:hypothetical protein
MILAKVIIDINGVLKTDLDGNNVINFYYEVKENYNTETLAFDSYYQYSYFIPVKDISQSLDTNLEGNLEHYEISYGTNQLAFSYGDYSLPDGTVFNPGVVSSFFAQIYP